MASMGFAEEMTVFTVSGILLYVGRERAASRDGLPAERVEAMKIRL